MKYVLDSSIGLKWVIVEPLSDKAQALRDEFRNGLHDLLAPDVFPVEVAHALTKAERQGRMTPPLGGTLWADVMTTAPRLHPSLPLIPRAYQIASRARIGVYDCLYVALAEREGCEFLTADTRLVNSVQAAYPFLKSLASRP